MDLYLQKNRKPETDHDIIDIISMKLDKTLEYGPEHLIKFEYLCGIDEVGRGCGAGPVVTAAVILPKVFHHHY
jgi:ribonuclease HII